MKTGTRLLLVALAAAVLAGLVPGCVGADPSMSTTLRADGSGERVFVVDVPSDDLSEVAGGAAGLEAALRAALPSGLTMTRAPSSGAVQFTFTMAFSDVGDLQQKLSGIAGKAVTVTLQREGSPFAPIYGYSESATAMAYFQWMSAAVERANITSYGASSFFDTSSGTNRFTVAGSSEGPFRWGVSTTPSFQWKAPVSLVRYDLLTEFSSKWAATRTVSLTVTKATAEEMEKSPSQLPVDFLKAAVPEGASVDRREAGDEVTYEVQFRAKDPADLQAKGQKLFGQDEVIVAQVKEGSSAFASRRTYSETLDPVSWLDFDAVNGATSTFKAMFPGRLVAEGTAGKDKSLTQPFSGPMAVSALVQQSNWLGLGIILGVILLVAGLVAFLLIWRRQHVMAALRKVGKAFVQFKDWVAKTAGAAAVAARGGSVELKCGACGAINSPNNTFCRGCGAKLDKANIQTVAGPEGGLKVRRFVSPALFGLILLVFLLPFLSVSCQGEKIATLSGYTVAFGTTIEEQRVAANALAIIALVAAVAGVALALVRFTGREIAAAAAGGLGFILLVVLKAKANSAVAEAGGAAKGEAGFFLSLLLFLGAIADNVQQLLAAKWPPYGLPPGLALGKGTQTAARDKGAV